MRVRAIGYCYRSKKRMLTIEAQLHIFSRAVERIVVHETEEEVNIQTALRSTLFAFETLEAQTSETAYVKNWRLILGPFKLTCTARREFPASMLEV